ncbi:MAG: PIN domain-containing protein [Ilumatobacteraceae bacterium]
MADVIVVDASALIAFLDPDDAHHTSAVDALAAATPPLIVHRITAAEVLVGPTRRGTVDAVWRDLVAIGVELDDDVIDPHALAALRVESGCKLPDCCVIAVARARGCDVVTFDARLAAALRE